MNTLFQDIKFGLRQLCKNPGFTIVVILILALGIGINATAFSVINAILFRPLPVQEPDQLVSLSIHTPEHAYDNTFSYPDLEFFRANTDLFEGVLTFQKMLLSWQRDQRRKVTVEWVSKDYFNLLGVKTCLGRFFSPEEQTVPQAYPVVILSHAFWRSEFDGREDIAGTDITINNHHYTVVGVAEAGFEGMQPSQSPDLWLPLVMIEQVYGSALTQDTNFDVIGRLRRGIRRRTAETQLTALLPELDKNFPRFNGQRSQGKVMLEPCGYGSLAGRERGSAWLASVIFLSVTGMVLLIACANMANLLLARAMARRREIATRLALGAGRIDLIRQLLCESLLLTLVGGSLGLWLSDSALTFFESIRPAGLKLPHAIGPDIRVVVFTVVLSLLTTLIFGLIPALQSTRLSISETLKQNQRLFGGERKRFNVRNILIAGQITFCVVLLMLAGVLLRHIRQTMNIDFGFDAKQTLLVQLPASVFTEKDVDPYSLHEQVLGRVRTLPGVDAASLVDQPQLSGGSTSSTVCLPGSENAQQAMTYNVGPDYFRTMRIPVRQGREFSLHDRQDQKKVAIINETLAQVLWPKDNPIGRTISYGQTQYEVCGIVATSKYHDARETPQPAVYYCSLQTGWPQVLIVRSKAQPAMLQRSLEDTIHALDPSMPRPQARTYTQQIRGLLIGERAASLFIAVIGAGGLLLASVGLYGIVSYMGRLRTGEIGVRIALGAQRIDIVRLVIRQAIVIIIIGLCVGMFLAMPFALFLSKITPFKLSIFDPVPFVIVASVLLITATCACLIPALRAAKTDPMEALRYE